MCVKKETCKITLNDDEFKRIRKEKQSVIIRLNNKENNNISVKDKVLLVNDKKKIKRKVKNLHTYTTIDDLSKNIKNKQLGYKRKATIDYDSLIKNYKKDDIKKQGLLGIELKKKKHIPKKIFYTILILVFVIVIGFDIHKKVDKRNIEKYSNIITEMNNDKLSYAFIEINPSFVLTIKGNKVDDIACTNDDCMAIYNDISIKGKNINESIDIIYNISKEKGFDTSKGVKIKSSESINIEKKDYITIEHIDTLAEKEILSKVKNNDNIKNIDNTDYYNKLWEELKKDNDYNKIYSCNMDSGKLECYFIIEAITPMADVLDESKPVTDIMSKNVLSVLNTVKKTLKKFNIKIVDTYFGTKLYINNIDYSYALDTTCFRKNITTECYGDLGCYEKMSLSKFNIKDLDLLNPSSIQDKISTI